MTGGPGKEHRTNKPPLGGRVQEKSKGDTMCLTTSQNPFHWHPSWLTNACTTRKDSESEGQTKDNPETNPITIKLETASHMAEQFSWVPLPYCSIPGHPFPIKSYCFVNRYVSSDNSFPSVRQEPTLGPWKGSLSCSITINILHLFKKVEESMNMTKKNMEDTKKSQKFFRDKIYIV